MNQFANLTGYLIGVASFLVVVFVAIVIGVVNGTGTRVLLQVGPKVQFLLLGLWIINLFLRILPDPFATFWLLGYWVMVEVISAIMAKKLMIAVLVAIVTCIPGVNSIKPIATSQMVVEIISVAVMCILYIVVSIILQSQRKK